MSADNGIYILKTIRTRKGGVKTEPHPIYRVAETSAIDNFDWYEKNQPYNLGAYMQDVWGNCAPYEDKNGALYYASQLEKSFSILEYGISEIETDYIFYGDM